MKHSLVPTALALAIAAAFSAQVLAEDQVLSDAGEYTGSWIVEENQVLNGNDKDLIFKNDSGNTLVVNGTIENLKNLEFDGGKLTNNGKISINGNFQVKDYGNIFNNGTIVTKSTSSEWNANITNNANATFEIKDGLLDINGNIKNDGTLVTHTDQVTIKYGRELEFGENAQILGAEGQYVSLLINKTNGNVAAFKNESKKLEVLNFTSYASITNNGEIYAHGDFVLDGNFTSGANSVLDVDQNAVFKAYLDPTTNRVMGDVSGNGGSFDVRGTLTFEGNVGGQFDSIRANSLITSQLSGFWVEILEELDVKNLSVGNYAAVKFDENVDAENKIVNVENLSFAQKGANLQLFSDLVVSNTVSAEFGGGIRFNEENYKASLNEVKVGEGSDFFLRSDEGNNQIKISTAIFGDNAKLTGTVNKETGEVEGTEIAISITDLTAEGNFTIDDTLLTSDGQIEIQNLHANGGEVKIDHELSGTSSVLSVNKGARVALGGVNTDTFNIELKTLEKGAVSVASVAKTTKTHVEVDGSLNNKEASEVIDAMNKALDLGAGDKEQFDYTIAEGDLFGAINGNSDGSHTQEENTKLTAMGSVTALSALTLRHEMNSLSKRMGELRDAPAGVGAWVRGYGSEMEYGAQSIKSKNNSIQMGSDYTVGDWKVGAALTYTDGESSYDNGSADNKGYGVAVYGTWFVPCGAYVDLMAKYNRLDNDFALNGMDGSYDANAYGVSAETGYRFNFMDGGVYVEPQVGIAYSRMTGETFTASNDVTIEQDDYDSLIGRMGVRTGFKFPKDKGTIYARISGVYDFQGEVKGIATKNDSMNTIEEDLGGAWLEVGVGANFNWTKDTYTYIDFERSNGGEVKENYRWNVGLRHTF